MIYPLPPGEGTHRRTHPACIYGVPLTETERLTLEVYATQGGVLEPIADRLCIHVNTLKYRLDRAKEKLGFTGDSRMFVAYLWINGYVPEISEPFVRAYESYLLGRLSNNPDVLPIMVGLKEFIQDTTKRYLRSAEDLERVAE